MIAAECPGCGKLEVFADDAELQKRGADPSPPGHHAVPEDPDADWICYGVPARIAEPARHADVVAKFAARSTYGLAELGPGRHERAGRREVVDGERLRKRAADSLEVTERLATEAERKTP